MCFNTKLWPQSTLLCLAMVLLFMGCQQQDQSAPSALGDKKPDAALFTSLPAASTGVDFRNIIPENSAMNSVVYQYIYNGAGVAIGDIDNDGYQDIYFVANLHENKLFLNTGAEQQNDGNLKFQDITNQAGVRGTTGWSTGVTMADVNADGWLDIYVCKSGNRTAEYRENLLFINNQDRTFTEAAADYGLNFSGYSTQAAFFDFDRDGDLDMYLMNHNIERINTRQPETLRTQSNDLVGDKLYKNENGKFVDVSKEAGIFNNPIGFGLGLSVSDLNRDGWPDIYVGNDFFEQDYMYINNGDGTFSESLKERTKHISYFSMGTDIADMNNDGWPDIITLDMAAENNYRTKTSMSGMNPANFNNFVKHGFHYQYMYNTLQLNQGGEHFSEIAQLSNIARTDWSWAPLMADFDNDGWKDLFITNGLKRDDRNNDFSIYRTRRIRKARQTNENMETVIQEIISKGPKRKSKNYFYSNNKDLTFSNKMDDWLKSEPSLSNGAAYGDLDNDGDLDLVVNNIDEDAYILINNSENNYLQIQFHGSESNKFGIGVEVQIISGRNIQIFENYPTRGYQSAVWPILHVGLEGLTQVDEVHVKWPDGKEQVLTGVPSNQRITINYDDAIQEEQDKVESEISALFLEKANALKHVHPHEENAYNDYKKESLLPHKLSQLGPALAIGDINSDGLDDFYLGGAKGYSGELYTQQDDGSFIPSGLDIWRADRDYEDIGAAFMDADGDGDADLYVVSGGNEWQENDAHLQDRLYVNIGQNEFQKANKSLPEIRSSGSCVKPHDFDHDGDIDLFVGGRLVPGNYLSPARSYILENKAGIYYDITKEIAPDLFKPGMVTDAIWTDFNHDNSIDLIVVGEWMGINYYQNNNGQFTKINPPFTNREGEMTGWWSAIGQGDLDDDGDTDYIVGNLGLNYKYQASENAPFEVYCNDFDDNGSQDIVLGYYDDGNLYPLRGRECSSNQMPFIKKKFPTYHDFGSAKLTDVYGADKLDNSNHLAARTFESVILQNNGNGLFEVLPLPNEAQISSINGIIISDWDQDGLNDFVVAGNMHQSEVETPRNDAGVGLFFKGIGPMEFDVVPPYQSNLYLDGDVKAMNLIHLGNNGDVGILVGNNNEAVQLMEVKAPLNN